MKRHDTCEHGALLSEGCDDCGLAPPVQNTTTTNTPTPATTREIAERIAKESVLRLLKAQEIKTGMLDLRVKKQREGFTIWLADAILTGMVARDRQTATVTDECAYTAPERVWLQLSKDPWTLDRLQVVGSMSLKDEGEYEGVEYLRKDLIAVGDAAIRKG